MHLPAEAIDAAQRAHVAAHGGDCGRGPGGGVAGPKSACMVVYRAWRQLELQRARERRTDNRERDKYIVTAFWAGMLLKDIGAQVGLGTARVGQVLRQHGINVRAERARLRGESPSERAPRKPKSPEARRRYRERNREAIAAYERRPEVKARKASRHQRYREANRARLIAYDRDRRAGMREALT